MKNTHNMSSMDEVKKMVESLSQSVSKMETNMSSLTAQVNLCFDQIVKLKGKPKEGDNVFGEGSHKGKHLEDEEGPTNHFSFSDHSHNLMPHFPKVDLNKFDGSESN
jgi:hypothetical protein